VRNLSTSNSDHVSIDSEAAAIAAKSCEPIPYLTASKAVWLRWVLFLAMISSVTALPVYIIDPYNLVRSGPQVVSPNIKREYAQSIDDPLWKLPLYDRNPAENILLGDSQMEHLTAEEISSVTGGKRYFNLAYGGGTLRESISTFWHAAARGRLRSVYFGVNFMAYNSSPSDRAAAADKIREHPLRYFYDSGVLQTSVYDALALIPGARMNSGPGMARDLFWQWQLDFLTNRYKNVAHKNVASPAILEDELVKIQEYARRNDIHLVFVITPQHVDAQYRVNDLGLAAEYARFKRYFTSLGSTLDCDIPSKITEDRRNYSDPFHLTDEAAKRIVEDIWTETFRWCHQLPTE